MGKQHSSKVRVEAKLLVKGLLLIQEKEKREKKERGGGEMKRSSKRTGGLKEDNDRFKEGGRGRGMAPKKVGSKGKVRFE